MLSHLNLALTVDLCMAHMLIINNNIQVDADFHDLELDARSEWLIVRGHIQR